MPELPEVEAARKAIEENCLGKKIKRVVVADDTKVIDGVSASDFESSVLGKTIVSARRKGKNLWLELDSPPFPSFHFGMAGAIYIKGIALTEYKRSAVKDTEEWPSKYSKFFVELEDGLELSFTDKRRFAKVRLLDNPASVPPISELGPDALLELKTVEEFAESIGKKKIGIKPLLLDQSFISGIGNWIADEVLYQAKVHPLQTASSLSKEQCAALHISIKEVIEKAVEVGADSSQFPSNWIFHSREKKPGKAFVDGKKIDFINAGGRTTAYVPELQKLSGKDAVKAAGKTRKQTSKKGAKGVEHDDEPDAEDEGEDENGDSKSKEVQKPRVRGKKPSRKRKPEESDEDDDDNNDKQQKDDEKDGSESNDDMKSIARGKKPARKRKSDCSDANADKGDDNGQIGADKKPAATTRTRASTRTTGKKVKG